MRFAPFTFGGMLYELSKLWYVFVDLIYVKASLLGFIALTMKSESKQNVKKS